MTLARAPQNSYRITVLPLWLGRLPWQPPELLAWVGPVLHILFGIMVVSPVLLGVGWGLQLYDVRARALRRARPAGRSAPRAHSDAWARGARISPGAR